MKYGIVTIYRAMTYLLPIQHSVIFFESNVGRNYTGNPKAIYEELVRQGLDKQYKCIWSLEDRSFVIPGNGKVVKKNQFGYLYTLAVAGIWVSDCRLPKFVRKRKGVQYIQTWHGTPLKKLGLDMKSVSMSDSTDIKQYHKEFIENTRTWDYLISQNAVSTKIFRRCFDFHKNMLEIGYPRNDILFRGNNSEYIQSLKNKLKLPHGKKILLYAPTWRDNEFYKNNCYKFSSNLDYHALKAALENEYILIVKYHYLVRETIDWNQYEGFIYQFSEKQDISELYLVSDMLITDYSSVMFDYSLLKRPMLFYAYDLESYQNNLRGFYFDFLAEAPGPIVQETNELIQAIKTFNRKDWDEKYKKFHNKYNDKDDGFASNKIVNLIQEFKRSKTE